MSYKAVLSLSLLTLSLVVTPPVQAGGGLVSFEVNPSESLNPGGQYVVRPMVYADNNYSNFCKNCEIQIKFENPQSGDYIAQSSNKTDDNGTMYAKVISNVAGIRYVYADVKMPDGSTYTSSKYTLNYTNYLPTATPKPVVSTYNVNTTTTQKPTVTSVTQTVSTSNHYNSVSQKVESSNSAVVENKTDLEAKIASLEAKVKESEKKQNQLEQRLNSLISWIKSVFPFIK